LEQLFVEKGYCFFFLRKALEAAIFQQCISVLHYFPPIKKQPEKCVKKTGYPQKHMQSVSLISTMFSVIYYFFPVTLTVNGPIWRRYMIGKRIQIRKFGRNSPKIISSNPIKQG